MSYLAIKHLHLSCVTLSLILFISRGLLVLRGLPIQNRFLKVAPHIVDSTLLAAAIALAYQSQQYPLQQPWLTAKVIALMIYIGLGTIALKRGRTLESKRAAFIAALLVFAYIVAVALTRSATLGY